MPMGIIQGYTDSLLSPQLRSWRLDDQQEKLVIADVTMRLESLLSHWADPAFRRTILVLGNEEATFWKPEDAPLKIRSLVVVAIRNSLIEDIHTDHPYTEALRSVVQMPDSIMAQITFKAIKYFQAFNLDTVTMNATQDVFGALPLRFPTAWHALSLLANSTGTEIACDLPVTKSKSVDDCETHMLTDNVSVVISGIDPGLDSKLANVIEQIERGRLSTFFSSSFRGISRNPEKVFSIIDRVLRHGGTVLTPNYLLSPSYIARRDPLVRPAQYEKEVQGRIGNPIGLSERHRAALIPYRC
jgi:hypothetical protein